MSEGLVKGEGFAVDASLIRANASEARAVDRGGSIDWSDPKIASRPVTEYLEAIDQAKDEDEAPRKKISLTDPTARWTAAVGGRARFTWSTNYLLDIETSVIVDVEATQAYRKSEVTAAQTMIDRTEELFGLKPNRLLGDGAYGSAEFLGWMVDDKKIAPHVTLLETPGRPTQSFTQKDFTYDKAKDVFTCPNGKELRHAWDVDDPYLALRSLPFVRYSRISFGGRQVDRYLTSHLIRPNDVVELDDITTILSLVGDGKGIAIVPKISAHSSLFAAVKTIEIPETNFKREVGILHPRLCPEPTKRFIALCKETPSI